MVASALEPAGLYHPGNEHDSCGVGFVVDIKGRKSHGIIAKGLQILLNLLHRGACGCEATTGDGAGVLVQMPDRFLRKATSGLDFTLPPAGRYGAGLVFLPRDRDEREQLRTLIERTVAANGHAVLGWRPVPGDDSCLGASARAAKPAESVSYCAQYQLSVNAFVDSWPDFIGVFARLPTVRTFTRLRTLKSCPKT